MKKNKREFVEKMLPLVDAFRGAKTMSPNTAEKEKLMHDSFGALLTSVIVVFDKYGFKEFDAAKGEKLDSSKYAVVEVREDPKATGSTVIESTRPGMYDSDGLVLRKALVIVSSPPKPVVVEDEKVEVNEGEGGDVEVGEDIEEEAKA